MIGIVRALCEEQVRLSKYVIILIEICVSLSMGRGWAVLVGPTLFYCHIFRQKKANRLVI